mgnify:CR=1 FL=1
MFRGPIVMTCCLSLATAFNTPAEAAAPADVAGRRAAVESGLTPNLRIEGRTTSGELRERMQHFHVPGVSIAVIHDGKLDWAQGYGFADAETETPVSTETLFQAASVSKPVAALCALALVERGRFDLDRDVNTWLTTNSPTSIMSIFAAFSAIPRDLRCTAFPVMR